MEEITICGGAVYRVANEDDLKMVFEKWGMHDEEIEEPTKYPVIVRPEWHGMPEYFYPADIRAMAGALGMRIEAEPDQENESEPTHQEYDITTLKDIWEKIPADRMRVFFDELSTQLITMAHMALMINEVGMAMDETSEPVLKFQMPDVFTWKDDGQGECLTIFDFGGEKLNFLIQRTPDDPNTDTP